MDETSSKINSVEIKTTSSSSSSDEFELVSPEKNEHEPVLFENNVEDLLNDAMGSTGASTPSMIVGKSIFYDCDEEIHQESTDEGLFFFVIKKSELLIYYYCCF
jgi:hypothetical protein